MEILKGQFRGLLIAVSLLSTWASASEIEMLLGLKATPIYSVKAPAENGLSNPYDLDVDPLTGNIFVANAANIGTAEGSNILSINPSNGQASHLPFFSQALAFAPDGTMYFGVSYFMLGGWFREGGDVFKKFAIIPAVRGVEIGSDDKLYVAEGSFGPSGLYPDSVLVVDRGDGYFQPVFSTEEAESEIGKSFDVMISLAVDNAGNLYAGYHSGELVKKRADGSYVELQQLHGLIGGLNEYNMASHGDKIYQYDVTTGQVFMWGQDEIPRLVAYGPSLKGSKSSTGGIAVTDQAIFLTGDYGVLFEISASNGGSLASVLEREEAVGSFSGTVIDLFTQQPIPNASITLNTGVSLSADNEGAFFSEGLRAGLYEVTVKKTDYRTKYTNIRITAEPNSPVVIALNPGLPEFVADGLISEIVASQAADGIAGSSDVFLDRNGDLYSMNYATSSISKHSFDPVTQAPTGSRVFASGGKLGNSFIVSVDRDLNVFASHGNDGVISLPQATGNESYVLTNDPDDATRVTDQSGVNRTISLVRDVDGIGVLSDGTLGLSSGSGGSASPGFPEGTTNTLVAHERSGAERILSRALDATGTSLFRNNDICKTDEQDRFLVGTANGNLVRVSQNGSAELIWPGDGTGKPEGLGAYSSIASDGQGHLFVRGALGDGSALAVRMIAPDGQSLMMLASGINQDFGGIAFSQDGKSLYISDDKLIIRIRSSNGRTIAENLLVPPSKLSVRADTETPVAPTNERGPRAGL